MLIIYINNVNYINYVDNVSTNYVCKLYRNLIN